MFLKTQTFWNPISSYQILLSQHFLDLIFWTQFFLDFFRKQNLLGTNIFGEPKFIGNQNLFGSFSPNFISSKKNQTLNFFWGTLNLKLRAGKPKLNTLTLILSSLLVCQVSGPYDFPRKLRVTGNLKECEPSLKSTRWILKYIGMENFYNSIKIRVNKAAYPAYFIGNMADSTLLHRKPRKISRSGSLRLRKDGIL